MSTQAIRIREAIVERMELLRRFTRIARVALPQLQPTDLPFCGVTISREIMTPDGDGNVGEPRFVSDMTICVSVVRAFTETGQLDINMDQDFADLTEALFTDPSFVTFGDCPLFESIERVDTRRLYPQVAETYVSELRMEITFRTRIYYEPAVEDTYLRTVLTARPLGHPDAPAVTIVIDQAQS